MKKYIFIIIIIPVILFLLYNTSQRRTQLKMATFVEITLNGPAWTDFNKVFDEAFLAMDDVIKMADRFNQDSQISRVNKLAFKHPVEIKVQLYDLIDESINISKNTDGAFDITVAPLVKLWGFYPHTFGESDSGKGVGVNKKEDKNPSPDKLKEALNLVGYENIILDETKGISFKKDGVELDLSAIAKGYAVDRAIEAIRRNRIKSAIVNAGGDMYCLGKKNFFQDWKIGIKDPKDKKRIITVLHLKDKAVATSGGYEKFIERNGKKYCHIIDPRTGAPAEVFCNATVVADSCALADGLATALCILDEDNTEKVKSRYNQRIEVFRY